MKSNRRMILSIVWIVLGASLLGCNLTGLLGDYWGGLGGGLLGVGVFQVVRNVRYLRNPEYREKVDTTNQDERNRFLANKAWAWAGKLPKLDQSPLSCLDMVWEERESILVITMCKEQ